MNKATPKLLATAAWLALPFNDAERVAYCKRMQQRGMYLALNPIDLDDNLHGEAAAEEVFDLTNHPGRQVEREAKYGTARSLSSGDLVTVDGQDWLCLSIGWTLLLDPKWEQA